MFGARTCTLSDGVVAVPQHGQRIRGPKARRAHDTAAPAARPSERLAEEDAGADEGRPVVRRRAAAATTTAPPAAATAGARGHALEGAAGESEEESVDRDSGGGDAAAAAAGTTDGDAARPEAECCPVCLEPFNQDAAHERVLLTTCLHELCISCVRRWIQQQQQQQQLGVGGPLCPLCKQGFTSYLRVAFPSGDLTEVALAESEGGAADDHRAPRATAISAQ
eukprot:scaffold1930_cov346-Prasinococcus_capsulatus_cf.AAC.1